MKYILTILLLLVALTATATSLDELLRDLPSPSLNQGITLPKSTPINDFTTLMAEPSQLYKHFVSVDGIPAGADKPYISFYKQDFSEDPFDGRIEIFVIGEPLPSPVQTLLIVLAVGGIIYCTRKQPVVV
jgi:hypothetical protein